MGMWRTKIFGWEIKTKSPDQAIKDTAKNIADSTAGIIEAVKSGNLDKLKKSIGDLVLATNPMMNGAEKVVHAALPHIPEEDLSKVIGTGFLAFATTGGSGILTVISAAEEFFQIYKVEPGPDGPVAPAGPTPRPKKKLRVHATQLTQWNKPDGTTELWAGFRRNPVFVDDKGKRKTWPRLDIREGDEVDITARMSPIKKVEGASSFSVESAKATYLKPANDTPGPGQDQITKTLIFKPI